jgi:8-oxo-dGTP pyrophosphatase MutT (NUDIX family)
MSFTESMSDPPLTASDLPERLSALLRQGPGGGGARLPLSPELSYGRHAGPAPHTAREAAVILLLFRRAGRWLLPLTVRQAALSRHGGQVSLPGGSVDPGESSSQAAMRELREELGIEGNVRLLGRLSDCYVFASDFVVTPWVATADFDPVWKPHDREVQGVVELPLGVLLDARSVGRMTVERGPLVFHSRCFRVNETCIWGATSVILSELAGVIQSFNKPRMNADNRG